MHDLDGPEAQRAGLLPAPVDLDEAQVQVGVGPLRHRADGPRLVHLGQVGLDPGRPHHMQGPAAAALGCRLQQEGPSEAVVGVEVRDHNDLDGLHGDPQRRRCGNAVGEGSTRTDSSMTKLFQYRPRGARKLPVPRKASSVT